QGREGLTLAQVESSIKQRARYKGSHTAMTRVEGPRSANQSVALSITQTDEITHHARAPGRNSPLGIRSRQLWFATCGTLPVARSWRSAHQHANDTARTRSSCCPCRQLPNTSLAAAVILTWKFSISLTKVSTSGMHRATLSRRSCNSNCRQVTNSFLGTC